MAILLIAWFRITSPVPDSQPVGIQPQSMDQEQISRDVSIAFFQLSFDKISPQQLDRKIFMIYSRNLVLGANTMPNLSSVEEDSVVLDPISEPNDPVALYKFDGNVRDSMGNAHGLLRGDPKYVQGVYSQAIRFDGCDDSVHIAGATSLFSNINTGITIGFWQFGEISSHNRDTICSSDYTDESKIPVISINLGCWKRPGHYNWDCGSLQGVNDRLNGAHQRETEWEGQWNHWAFTKDVRSGKMQIFLNGRLYASRDDATSTISGVTSFKIGSGWYGGYDGLIDDFRIYDHALTRSQVAYIATGGTGVFSRPFTSNAERPLGAGVNNNDSQDVFVLRYLTSERCIALLCELGVGQVALATGTNAVLIKGSPEQLRMASLVIELTDSTEYYVVDTLGPASLARTLPSNSQIETALGVEIGTFLNPPRIGGHRRGIIDIRGDSIVAIVPARYREQLWRILASSSTGTGANHDLRTGIESNAKTKQISVASRAQGADTVNVIPRLNDRDSEHAETVRVLLKHAQENNDKMSPTDGIRSAAFENGEDIIDLDFPETMTLKQLLELAGEYLDLDYVYDPAVIGNQTVALKFQGKVKGNMKVKDLYILLETVLKFNGLAMTTRGGKLVAIVPVGQVLDADPKFIDESNKTVQAGDIVVTRIFETKHVDVTSVANVLNQMRLGTVVSPSQETQLLFVTCYANRMNRIEELIRMIDRPGRSKECRFRRLKYTAAPVLAAKLRTLSMEVQSAAHVDPSAIGKPPAQQNNGLTGPGPVAKSGQQIYLEADERTNRIVMIGHEEQLEFIEELIKVFDVSQEDLRIPMTYDIMHMEAQEALRKLQDLQVLGPQKVSGVASPIPTQPPSPAGVSSPRSVSQPNAERTEEANVVVLEATNQLLVRATQEQHNRISELLGYIDAIPEDIRTFQVYEIQHVDAEEVKTKLEELEMIRVRQTPYERTTVSQQTGSATIRRTNPPGVRSLATTNSIDSIDTSENFAEKPQVVVIEPTNSLLVNATAVQHAQLATVINYIDRKLPEADIPYKIYPLENSSPQHVADLLERLITKTTKDEEGKVQQVTAEESEQITIVPDPNTFSLIVYASRKNQEWIEKLAKNLDKRRPQVLIDVTLVEITRAERFEYDLNIVASADEAVIGNIGIEPIHRINSKSLLEGSFNLPDQEGNSTGQTRAFYSDEKVQALLSAIERKNYGRVLAKPKILVDDGQEGEISTTDETTYLKESVQVPNQGSPITTRDFQPIEAKIQLQITPHISEGDLLRLDVHLSRGDFGTRPAEGAPPDKTTSEVNTTVFVPDNNTVILGGLVKLNQSKGGSKVPILGDIPLIGVLFRSVDNSDVEKKLYVFLKANIVRPYEKAETEDLHKISEENRKAFEKSESEFQNHEDIPGIKPESMQPERVLDEP